MSTTTRTSTTRARQPRSRGTRWAVAAGTAVATAVLGVVAGPAAPAQAALPSAEVSSPAVTSPDAGRLDLFTLKGDDVLQQYLLPGGSWRRPLNRGGTLKSQPAAVSWGAGRLDVFARGTDNHLYQRTYASGAWSSWSSLGGTLTSAPAVASWAPGRLDVVVRGLNNALYWRSFSGGSWNPWARVGGSLTSSPSVASWGAGRLDVVARGASNHAVHASYVSGTGWSAWESLGGTLTSQPAVSAPEAGRLDVVARVTGSTLATTSLTSGTWSGFTTLGATTFTSGPGAAMVDGELVVVARRENGFLYRATRATPGAAWSSWRIVDQYVAFRRLATWVDTLDYAALDPASSIADMKARGVRTLFLGTARFNSTSDFFDEAEMAQWLDTAHANGIRVVGWYVPAYGDMARDVRRTAAIGRYLSPNGERFDGVGVDIERYGADGEVSHATFNSRAVTQLHDVRAQTSAPIAAITPSPYGTDAGNHWSGFPWSGVAANSEVVVPMALWSFRSNHTPTQTYTWVKDQVDRAQALTGRRVHVEGGVYGEPASGGTTVDSAHVRQFVRAAIDAGAIGGSQYDYNTMNGAGEPTGLWADLAPLNDL